MFIFFTKTFHILFYVLPFRMTCHFLKNKSKFFTIDIVSVLYLRYTGKELFNINFIIEPSRASTNIESYQLTMFRVFRSVSRVL